MSGQQLWLDLSGFDTTPKDKHCCRWCGATKTLEPWRVVEGVALICADCKKTFRRRRRRRQSSHDGCQTLFPFMYH
jgi:hypothetical protein